MVQRDAVILGLDERLGLVLQQVSRHSVHEVRDVLERPRTPLRQLISYKLKEAWRKAQVKMLHLMPAEMQDRKLEARYKAIMGAGEKAPEVYPGSPDAAIADGKQA